MSIPDQFPHRFTTLGGADQTKVRQPIRQEDQSEAEESLHAEFEEQTAHYEDGPMRDAAPSQQITQCPTCLADWKLFAPAKIDGAPVVRCVECKAVYPEHMTATPNAAAVIAGNAPDIRTMSDRELAIWLHANYADVEMEDAEDRFDCLASSSIFGWLYVAACVRELCAPPANPVIATTVDKRGPEC